MMEQFICFCVSFFYKILSFLNKKSNNIISVITKRYFNKLVSVATTAADVELKIKQIKRAYAFRTKATYNK